MTDLRKPTRSLTSTASKSTHDVSAQHNGMTRVDDANPSHVDIQPDTAQTDQGLDGLELGLVGHGRGQRSPAPLHKSVCIVHALL